MLTPSTCIHRYKIREGVLFSCSVMSNSLGRYGLQHAKLPCPSPTPEACSNLCPSSRWCHPIISPSIVSSRLQSFPASGSFPVIQLFISGDQTIGASASALGLPLNIQGWFPLGLAGLISLQFKGLSKVFFSTTVQKHHLTYYIIFKQHSRTTFSIKILLEVLVMVF